MNNIVDNDSVHCDWPVTDPDLPIRLGGGGGDGYGVNLENEDDDKAKY